MSLKLGQESCWHKRNLFHIVSITKALFCEISLQHFLSLPTFFFFFPFFRVSLSQFRRERSRSDICIAIHHHKNPSWRSQSVQGPSPASIPERLFPLPTSDCHLEPECTASHGRDRNVTAATEMSAPAKREKQTENSHSRKLQPT